MDEAVFDELMEWFQDDNGSELEIPKTAKKWREKEAKLFKILWKQQESNTKKLDKLLVVLDGNPPIIYWIRNHLKSAFATFSGTVVFFMVLWFIFYDIANQPGIAEWMHMWLHIPIPP